MPVSSTKLVVAVKLVSFRMPVVDRLALAKAAEPESVSEVRLAAPPEVTLQLADCRVTLAPLLPIDVAAVPEVLTLVAPSTVVVELALPMLVAADPEVFRLVAPVEPNVVKAPDEAVVAPMAVELIPVEVVLKLLDVKVMFWPLFRAIVEAPRLFRLMAPEVPVRLTAPVVTVKPLLAVKVWETVRAPLLVVVTPDLPMLMAVAVVVPMDSVPALATSTAGAKKEVSERPEPCIQKVAPVCWAEFWFWM